LIEKRKEEEEREKQVGNVDVCLSKLDVGAVQQQPA
jgi:hypothetical protein